MRGFKKAMVFLVLLGALTILWGAVPVGNTAPDFTISYYDWNNQVISDSIKLSDFQGKVVALIFGSYC